MRPPQRGRSLAAALLARSLLALLLALLAGCAHATPSVNPDSLGGTPPGAAPGGSQPASPAGAATPQTSPGSSAGASGAASAASGSPAAAGIDAGTPALVHVGDRYLPVVVVTNTSGAARSFTIAATWKKGDTIAATEEGSVFALQPGETRVANLASQSGSPAAGDTAEAHVDRILPLDQHQSDVVSKIQFGRTAIHHGQLSSLEVLVTNTDTAPHTLMLGGALLAKGVPIATASGSATLGARLALPVMLSLAGDDSGFDQILAYVTAVLS
ncbi:MAG TPA: hypothetical protein VK009_24115 [Chloroflexota bacterium]|nr:hypothetical protein [Chloroflexota bacterium]